MGRNLKPFKPGQSGNPLGRPIGAKTGLRSRITRLLDKEASPDILKTLKAEGIELEDRDNAEVIAHILYLIDNIFLILLNKNHDSYIDSLFD